MFKRLITLAAIGAASYLLMKLAEEEKEEEVRLPEDDDDEEAADAEAEAVEEEPVFEEEKTEESTAAEVKAVLEEIAEEEVKEAAEEKAEEAKEKPKEERLITKPVMTEAEIEAALDILEAKLMAKMAEAKKDLEDINEKARELEENEEGRNVVAQDEGEKEKVREENQSRSARKLLGLQVDLILVNYPDTRVFLLQHHLLPAENMDALEAELKERNYIITMDQSGYNAQKVMINKDTDIKDEILYVHDKITEAGGLYRGFNVIPQ